MNEGIHGTAVPVFDSGCMSREGNVVNGDGDAGGAVKHEMVMFPGGNLQRARQNGRFGAAIDLTLERRDRGLRARAFIWHKENVEWGDGLLDTPTSKGDEITVRPRRGGRIAGIYRDFPHHFLQVVDAIERIFELPVVRGRNEEAGIVAFGNGGGTVYGEGKDAVEIPERASPTMGTRDGVRDEKAPWFEKQNSAFDHDPRAGFVRAVPAGEKVPGCGAAELYVFAAYLRPGGRGPFDDDVVVRLFGTEIHIPGGIVGPETGDFGDKGDTAGVEVDVQICPYDCARRAIARG